LEPARKALYCSRHTSKTFSSPQWRYHIEEVGAILFPSKALAVSLKKAKEKVKKSDFSYAEAGSRVDLELAHSVGSAPTMWAYNSLAGHQ
jgi:hypothetical protein